MNNHKSHNKRNLIKEYVKNRKQSIIIGNYKIVEFIGKGSYGEVYKAINIKNEKVYAIKLCDKQQISQQQSEYIRNKQLQLLKTEGILMKKCNSDYVIKCYDILEDEKDKLFILEYCSGGTLNKIIEQKAIPQADAIAILKQLILGLSQLHKNKIIHRDLKAENIIRHNGVYKICDFGFCKQLNHKDQIGQFTQLGTKATMAPQVKNNKPYGLKADVYSIGIIFYTMICSQKNLYERYIMAARKQFQFKTAMKQSPSQQTLAFLRDTLTENPKERLSWNQMLDHPIFYKKEDNLYNEIVQSASLISQKQKKQQKDEIKFKNVIQYQQSIQNKSKDINEEISVIQDNNYRKRRAQSVISSRQKINSSVDDSKLFEEMRINYLQCLKTQYILKQIIIPLQKNKLLNLKSREDVEMICLLIFRCFLNVSWCKIKIKQNTKQKQKQKLSKSEFTNISQNKKQNKIQEDNKINQMLNKYLQQITPLYIMVTQTKNIYENRLTLLESQNKHKLFDFFGFIFNRTKNLEKDIMLGGIQKLDYQKQEQIQYTHCNYIMNFANYLDHKGKQGKIIAARLRAYKFINEITLENVKKIPFRLKVQQVIGNK